MYPPAPLTALQFTVMLPVVPVLESSVGGGSGVLPAASFDTPLGPTELVA